MNTKMLFQAIVLGVAVSGRGLFAEDAALVAPAIRLPQEDAAAPAACCAPVAAKPACCETDGAVASSVEAAPFSDRSLYQLDATWTDDAGETRSLASLRGRVVVLTMFFASCNYACPVLVSDLQRLRELLPPDVREAARFVLVSFDTARDTPEVLSAFRERSWLDRSWVILRGEDDPVRELAMLLGVKFKREASGQFSHSNLITVLNTEGEIAYQRNGLMGDVSEAAKAVTLVSPKK